MKNNQKGYNALAVLLLLVIVGMIVGVGWFVVDSGKKVDKPAQNQNQSASTDTSNTDKSKVVGYLEIKEWEIKIPLTENTKNATYEVFGETSIKLLSKIEGDTVGACNNQAAINKFSDPQKYADENDSTLDQVKATSSKVGNNYYTFIGTQSGCTDDDKLQAKATAIRQDWLSQRTKITSLE